MTHNLGPRNLADVFGTWPEDEGSTPIYTGSALELAASIYSLVHLAHTTKDADGAATLNTLHAASLLCNELWERLRPYGRWTPPPPRIPGPLGDPRP